MADFWDKDKPAAAPAFGQNDPTPQEAAAQWRLRTNAPADMPSPYDFAAAQPAAPGQASLSDRITNFSQAAGEGLTSGLMHAENAAKMAAAGVPVALGDKMAADAVFSSIQPQAEQAQRLEEAASRTSRPGAITGQLLSILPQVMAGEAVLPARGAEAASFIGRGVDALRRGLPVAAGLGTEQSATQAIDLTNAGAPTDAALRAYAVGLPANTLANLAPLGMPGSIPVRVATGGAVGALTGAGTQEAQHLANPDYVPAPTLDSITEQGGIGAVMNALLGGKGRVPIDPHLQAYVDSAREAPATNAPRGTLELPPPEAPVAASAEPAAVVPPASSEAPVAPTAQAEAPSVPSPKVAEATFRADPAMALRSLDHPTLVQVARDAGLDVNLGEDRASIVGKLVGTGKDYLHSDVLPEYVAAVTSPPNAPSKAPEGATMAPEAPINAPSAPSLVPGQPVAVDQGGTAYTPEQGIRTIGDAIRAQQPAGLGLPEPRTIVDTSGNAVDSAAYLRQLRDDQAAQEQALAKQQSQRDLGLTPDIQRANAARWERQAAENARSAKDMAAREADRQAMLDARNAESGDVVGQRLEDMPPQFGDVEASRAADRQAMQDARDAESSDIAAQGGNDVPPWWMAALDAERSHSNARQPEAVPPADRSGVQAVGEGAAQDAAPAANGSREPAAADEPAALTDSPSWVIRNKETGEAVMETFDRHTAESINHAKYEAVPALQHLQELNNPQSQAGAYSRRAGEVSAKVEQPTADAQSARGALSEPSVATGERVSEPFRESDVSFIPQADRREDWSPEVNGRAITALDDLVQRYGGSTLADSIRNDLREHQTAQLIGKRITGPDDLAAIASVYRNPAFETMRYVFVDRNGTVLGETALSSRMPSSAVAFPMGSTNGVDWVMAQAPQGATGVWMVHNHPSGNPKPSKGDLDVTSALGLRLGDRAGAPKLQGHVILDHTTYGHIDALGDYTGIGKVPGAYGPDLTRERRGDNTMFDVKVTDPGFAAATGKRIAAATPDNSSAVVVMDAQGRVVSVHTFPNDFLTTPRGAAMVSRLGGKRGAVGLGIVMSAENFAKHRDVFNVAAERGLWRDAIVVAPNGSALNLAGTSLLPKEQRQNFGQQSAGTKSRSETGTRVFEEPATAEPAPISLTAVKRALAERGVSQDKIDAMSRDELRAEQANLRRRSPPTPEEQAQEQAAPKTEGETTGIKDATVAEERALKGKDEVDYEGKRQFGDTWAEAARRRAQDPTYGMDLAREIIAKPRALNAEETAALIQDRNRMYVEHAQARERVASAMERGDAIDEAQGRARMQVLEDELEISDQAARASSYEQGLGLAARRMMSKRDYSMAEMVTKAKVAKGGPLSSAERAEVERLAQLIEAKDKEIAALKAKQMERRAAPKGSPEARRSADKAFADLSAQLKAIAMKDQLKPGCIA